MRHQCEGDCPPTDVDIGMMILLFSELRDAPHRINSVEKRRKFDGSAQGTSRMFPAGQIN